MLELFNFTWPFFDSSTPQQPKTRKAAAAVEAPPSGPRRPKVIIPVVLKKGGLSKFGYHSLDPIRTRHAALMRAVKAEGFLPIIKRLTVISTFDRYRSPRYARIFKKDQEWLSKLHEKEKAKESFVRPKMNRSRGGGGLSAQPSGNRGSMMNTSTVPQVRQIDYDDDDDDDNDYEEEEQPEAEAEAEPEDKADENFYEEDEEDDVQGDEEEEPVDDDEY